MQKLTKEQTEIFIKKLNEYKLDLQDMSKVEQIRNKLLVVISSIYGEKSSQYKKCTDIGFSSWANGRYSESDRDSFMNLIDGILDTLEIFNGGSET